jgi:hypothetical protein
VKLAEALALVWIQQDKPELDAHACLERIIAEVRASRAEIRREIRRARQIGLDRYRAEVGKGSV